MVLSCLEATLILGIAFYPMAVIWEFLRPKPEGEVPWKRALVSSLALGLFIGGVATILVWVMFAWW
jgi:type III secretory pathway component EscT